MKYLVLFCIINKQEHFHKLPDSLKTPQREYYLTFETDTICNKRLEFHSKQGIIEYFSPTIFDNKKEYINIEVYEFQTKKVNMFFKK